MTLKELVITWGSFAIAVIALVQPWVIALWKRYARSGRIEIYETNLIEVGYSTFGPTVGLLGTLRAVDSDLFVRGIKLEVVRQKDRSNHSFDWVVFRTQALTDGSASLEMAYSFMLLTQQPFRYNILFRDTELFEELRPSLDRLRDEWFVRWQEKKGPAATRAMELASEPDPLDETFSEFLHEQTAVSTYGLLQRKLFWEAGNYQLYMAVTTSNPTRTFKKSWNFSLDENEAERLRLNALQMIYQTCDVPSGGRYNFAYRKYEP